MQARIAFILPTKLEVYGGTEKWVLKIAEELNRKGYKIYIFAPNYIRKGDKKRIIIDKKELIKNGIIYNSGGIFFNFRTFMEYFVPRNLDIIYIVSPLESTFQPLFGKKVILGTHALLHLKGKGNKLKFAFFLILTFLIYRFKKIKVHTLNTWQYFLFKKIGYRHVFIIPNFIDPNNYLYPQRINEFVILFLGRFSTHKGIDLLPKIIENVLEINTEIKFWICGSGDSYYENLIKKLEEKYPENVKYFGFVSEEKKKELLSKASLFLAPSRVEGQPIAVLEALVSGCPFLGSNIVAFRDLIKLYDKSFGWVVKEYSPEVFAKKILEIYQKWKENSDEYLERRKYIAKKAREIFDIERISRRFIEVFLKD